MARDSNGRDKFEAREEDIGASDYRAYFDSSVLRVWHLDGKERIFRIARVTRLESEVYDEGKRKKTKQPLLRLQNARGEDVPLPLALNKTNAKAIARLYGNDPRKWAGHLIALYATTTDVGGETKDCIRIRNEDPAKRARKGGKPKPEQAPEREPGDDQDEEMHAAAPSIPPSDPLDHERAPESEEPEEDAAE